MPFVVRPSCLTLVTTALLLVLAVSVLLSNADTRHHVVGHPAVLPFLHRLGFSFDQPYLPAALPAQETHANTTASGRPHRMPSRPKQHAKPPIATTMQTYACPSPFEAPPPTPAETPQMDRKACRSIPSRSRSFDLQLCPLVEPGTCNAFVVLVKRRDSHYCSRTERLIKPENISSVPGEGEWVQKTLGPDAFELTVDGTQRIVIVYPTAFDSTTCEWRYDVRLANGGDWTLRVAHFFGEYHAFRELWEDEVGPWRGKEWDQPGRVPAWPRLLDSGLAEHPIRSQDLPQPMSCPSSCPSYTFGDQPHRRLLPATSMTDSLPLCSTTERIPHIFLPDPHPYKAPESKDMALYRPHPLGCRLSPSDIALLDLETPNADRAACLSRRPMRLVIQGDSHGRMFYDALLPRLVGDGAKPTYAKRRLKRHRIGKTILEFIWDPLLNATMLDEAIEDGGSAPSTADLLILTAGAHQAYEHHSTSAFLGTIANISTTLSRRAAARRPTLFISSPAYPPRKGKYVWDTRDWRNNYRLGNWSGESLAMMRRMGASISDGYASTLPFVRDSPDHAHFRDTPSMEWWMMETLHKLALCSHDDEPRRLSAAEDGNEEGQARFEVLELRDADVEHDPLE